MEQESIDLVQQIERCRRLASLLSDEQMRTALVDLADDYEAELKRRPKPFMLRRKD